jgi:hypothetical protein
MVFKKQCTPFPPERESAQMERQFHRSVPFHPILDPAAISVKPQRSSSPRLDAYAYINGLNVLAESFFTSMSSADQLEVFRQRKADYETKSRQRRLTVTRGRDDAEANRRDDAASCLFDPLIWYFDSDLEMAELRLMEIAVGPKHAVAATQAPEVPVLPKRTLLDYLDYVLHDSWLNRPFPSSGGFPWY